MIESVEQAKPQAALSGVLKYWGPPLIWMSAIFYFSTDSFSGDNTGSLLWKVFSFIHPEITRESFASIHFYIRKAGHFTEYAILASLLFRAFRSGAVERWRWKWAAGSLLIAAVYALSDEYHQTLTRHRVGSIYDSLIDISGAVAALILLWLIKRSMR